MIAWHINRCVAQESTDWARITFFSGVCRENIDILWINKTNIDIYVITICQTNSFCSAQTNYFGSRRLIWPIFHSERVWFHILNCELTPPCSGHSQGLLTCYFRDFANSFSLAKSPETSASFLDLDHRLICASRRRASTKVSNSSEYRRSTEGSIWVVRRACPE